MNNNNIINIKYKKFNNILLFFIILLLCINFIKCENQQQQQQKSFSEFNNNNNLTINELSIKCSLASFVYLDNINEVYGAISLAKSFHQTHSIMDMNLIVHPPNFGSISTPYHKLIAMLKKAGWNVIITSPIPTITENTPPLFPLSSSISSNNGKKEEKIQEKEKKEKTNKDQVIFNSIMAQFLPFTMEEYDIIVYVDPNMIVANNIDELCRCYKTRLGSVIQLYSGKVDFETVQHRIGVLTLKPSKDVYYNIETAVQNNEVVFPRDVFKLFYDLQQCPYYDPLQQIGIPAHECVRLPMRYLVDIIYQSISIWFEQEEDPPKIFYYSIANFQPFSWWSLLILPEYWRWVSSYLMVLENVSILIYGKNIFYLIISLIIIYIPLSTAVSTSSRRYLSNLIYTYVYDVKLRNFKSFFCFKKKKSSFNNKNNNNHEDEDEEQKNDNLMISRLIIFHVLNFICVVLALQLSDVITIHPYFDMTIFVYTLTSLMYLLLFIHLPAKIKAVTTLKYCMSSLMFYAILMTFNHVFADFVSRIIILIFYFIITHGIWFTYLITKIPLVSSKSNINIILSSSFSSSSS